MSRKSRLTCRRRPGSGQGTVANHVMLLLATTAFAATSTRTLAQAESGGAADDGEKEDVTEIVVRGEARRFLPDEQTSATGLRMKLIETPQAISVVTPEMLTIANARTAYDVADMVPEVEKAGQSTSREYLMMRGRSMSGDRARFNGIGGTRNSFPDAFALDRIEFVRGPATALYGVTAAFGGEVNSVLKAPRKTPRFEAAAHFGDFDRKRYELDVTGAIPGTGERLTARAVGSYGEDGSWVEGIDRINRDKMLLLSAEYELPADWRAAFYYYRQEVDRDPTDGCAMLLRADGTLALPDIDAEHFYCGDSRNSFQDQTSEFTMGSLERSFGKGWEFRLIAGKATTEEVFSYMYPFGPGGAYGLDDYDVYLYTYDWSARQEQLTINASLGGEFDGLPWKPRFFAALEYNDKPKAGNRSSFLRSVGVGILDMRDGGRGVLDDGSPIPFVDRSTLPIAADRVSDQRAYRASLQVLLNPTERLGVLVGLLYEDTQIFQQRVVPLVTPVDQDFSKLVKRLGATHKLTNGGPRLNDARIYATYAEGYTPNFAVFGQNGKPLTDPQVMDALRGRPEGRVLRQRRLHNARIVRAEGHQHSCVGSDAWGPG